MLAATIGFLGAGQMAQALAAGFVRAGLAKPEQIIAFDPFPAAGKRFLEVIPGARLAADNRSVTREAATLFLAVKPQVAPQLFAELAEVDLTQTLAISILAGVTLSQLKQGLRSGRVIRVMPNTPCLIGAGASAFALGPEATPADAAACQSLLAAVGVARQVDEKLLDAVTGLSGSGPAFVFLMIEALSDGGVKAGLPRELSTLLAAQTVAGAAQLLLQTGEHPGVLKDRVASPGGTTIAGLAELEARGLRGALIAAVDLAARRSKELGQ